MRVCLGFGSLITWQILHGPLGEKLLQMMYEFRNNNFIHYNFRWNVIEKIYLKIGFLILHLWIYYCYCDTCTHRANCVNQRNCMCAYKILTIVSCLEFFNGLLRLLSFVVEFKEYTTLAFFAIRIQISSQVSHIEVF